MKNLRLSRRSFGLGALGLALSSVVAGAGSTSPRRFLFVHAIGGWDPLTVFAPMFEAPLIQMETGDAPLTVGGFDLVDGPNRPSVKAFFEKFGDRTLLVNGLSTRDVNHLASLTMALTGSLSDSEADWATLLAAAEAGRYHLPHLVLNCSCFPGEHAVFVGHGEGLLQEAVDGSIVALGDLPLVAPSDAARGRVDGFLADRAARFAAAHGAVPLSAIYQEASDRARGLTDAKGAVHFTAAHDFLGRADNAIKLLGNGVSRCASLGTDDKHLWDTHGKNSDQQILFETLFSGLSTILAGLAATQTPEGGALADETVVVVLSEMGRTPAFNDNDKGRDHWPYTSALVIGPGITGGRAIGGFSDHYVGIGVDPKTGDLDPSRPGIDALSFGATLLALGGVDPGAVLPGGEAITGVLA